MAIKVRMIVMLLGKKPENKVLFAQSCPIHCTPWTVARQAPLSMEFSSQEHWRGLSFPSPGDLPDPGIEPGSPAVLANSLPSELLRKSDAIRNALVKFLKLNSFRY